MTAVLLVLLESSDTAADAELSGNNRSMQTVLRESLHE